MFVSFEGIDGSGKTTLSALVVERLRARGRDVVHARENGVLATAVARRVRELTRDARLLEMSGRAELFLNLAREAQQLDEVVRPALARGATVIADRSLHSLVALSAAGRGLPPDEVQRAVDVAAARTWPDLVVLVDVDPDLARLRKRVAKVLAGAEPDGESRKGLAGAGLQARIRRHLRAEADAHPDRWVVARNEGRSLEALAAEIAGAILAWRERGSRATARGRRPAAVATAATAALVDAAAPERIAAAFFAEVERLSRCEPALAAFLLHGLPGEAEHALRVDLAPRAPELVAWSLRGLSGERAWALRRALAPVAPRAVAGSLGADPSSAAMALRAALLDAAPRQVLASLEGNRSPAAWALRRDGVARGELEAVVAGLAGVDEPSAWALRDEAARRELWAALGRSLAGLAGPRADARRAELAAHDRLAALRATAGLDGDAARALRERLFEHAPKRVLRSLAGIDAPYAWALRERALGSTKEALDSVDGMDHPRAWQLREAGVDLWPATAVSSLVELAGTARGLALVARGLRVAPGSLAVLRNAHAALARAAAEPAPRERLAALEEETCSM